MKMDSLRKTFSLLEAHEKKTNASFSLVPSENVLSPLAKRPLNYSAYSRYFFNDLSIWGKWAFHGGKLIGEVEEDILIPELKKMTRSKYLNVKPISGLSCMQLALASYCGIREKVMVMSPELGGHASTVFIAKRFGLIPILIPAKNIYDIDFDRFAELLKKHKPKLIYIDQSTVLFPVNVSEIKQTVERYSPLTKIHYDTSHINAFVLGNVFPNPLQNGADSFGGSTHKSFPGPHKGYLATNDEKIAKKIDVNSRNLISHHHMADVISFTIAVLEFKNKNGSVYAMQTIKNAKHFGRTAFSLGIKVVAPERDFTNCHQIWIDPGKDYDTYLASEKLFEAGLLVNCFGGLPGIPYPAFRLGFNEVTFLGLKEQEISVLVKCFYDILFFRKKPIIIAKIIKNLRLKFKTPMYCFSKKEYLKFLKI